MKIYSSIENIQDIHAGLSLIGQLHKGMITEEEIESWRLVMEFRFRGPVRTPEPTEEEVRGWQEAYSWLCSLDLERVRRKVAFLSETDKWYEDPEWWSW